MQLQPAVVWRRRRGGLLPLGLALPLFLGPLVLIVRGTLGGTAFGVDSGVRFKLLKTEVGVGQEITGQVTKVRSAGAELDLGLDLPGWLHISQISDERVADINDVLAEGQEIKARVRRRKGNEIEVTMRDLPNFNKRPLSEYTKGKEVDGEVVSVSRTAVWVDIGAMANVELPFTNIKHGGWSEVQNIFKKGDRLKATITEASPLTPKLSTEVVEKES